MSLTSLQRRGGVLLLAATAAVVLLLSIGSPSLLLGVPPPAAGPSELNVVMVGSYTCDVSDVLYLPPGSSEPQSFREMSDRISITATGGVPSPALASMPPGFGGRTVPDRTPPITPGIGTGHSFNGGTIEDCVRFTESVAGATRGAGCVTSEPRHRPALAALQSESLSFSFVCEGPAASQLHTIGDLSRTVLALKPLPTP